MVCCEGASTAEDLAGGWRVEEPWNLQLIFAAKGASATELNTSPHSNCPLCMPIKEYIVKISTLWEGLDRCLVDVARWGRDSGGANNGRGRGSLT